MTIPVTPRIFYNSPRGAHYFVPRYKIYVYSIRGVEHGTLAQQMFSSLPQHNVVNRFLSFFLVSGEIVLRNFTRLANHG